MKKQYYKELVFTSKNEDIQIALDDDNTCVTFKFYNEYETGVSINELKTIKEIIEEILKITEK